MIPCGISRRDWLRYGRGEMLLETREALIQNVTDKFNLTPDETVLLRMFLDLPAEHRAGVIEFAKKFVASLVAQKAEPQPVPDDEKTVAQMRETMDAEFAAMEESQKKGTQTSSASTGTNGTSKKIGNGS